MIPQFIKDMTKKIFAIKEGDKLRYLKIKRQKVNLPPYGILTAEELMENPEALKTLILRSPDSSIFEDADKKEYEAQLAAEEAETKKAEEEEKASALEAAKAEYEKAKAIVAEYEAKYLEKKSTKK